MIKRHADLIKKNVDDNKRFEELFQKYILDKFGIEIDKHPNNFKLYDFYYNKNIKIEYKGIYYTLNSTDNTATNYKNTVINSVMISKHKISYYKSRKIKNPKLKFFLFYGFYDVVNYEVKKITIRFIDITDKLDDIIINCRTVLYENIKQYLIPIIDLKKPNKFMFIQ